MNHQCKDCRAEQEAYDNWCADPGARGHEKPMPALPAATVRPVKAPGPRCVSHMRKEKERRRKAAHEKRVQKVYGLSDGDYDRLYEHQGGRCYLCRRATGRSRKLAVDHDHATGLVYGLLCSPCNKDVMGHSRRDVAYFVRCLQYLDNPPARQLHITAYHVENRGEDG